MKKTPALLLAPLLLASLLGPGSLLRGSTRVATAAHPAPEPAPPQELVAEAPPLAELPSARLPVEGQARAETTLPPRGKDHRPEATRKRSERLALLLQGLPLDPPATADEKRVAARLRRARR